MKKKKLKRRLKRMEAEITLLKQRPNCKYCENHQPKKVRFERYRWPPLPPLEKEIPIHLGYLQEDKQLTK